MSWLDTVTECIGLKVRPGGEGLQVIVETGWLQLKDGTRVQYESSCQLSVRASGSRSLSRQVYHIEGEGDVSPCHWNGENRRGSGSSPFHRMVPGSLKVFDRERKVLYERVRDYVYDYYWGTIKRHPQGRIPAGAELSLDYEVWLCRYDAVVAGKDGSVFLVEGPEEAPESRELLLPEPPSALADGYVLAHLFLGWGQNRIYDGEWKVEGRGLRPGSPLPALSGRYSDSVPRRYLAEVTCTDASRSRISVRLAATGEDYGTGAYLDEDSLRWTEPAEYSADQKVPLSLKSAYGHEVDWGLELDFSQSQFAGEGEASITIKVTAHPSLIFDLRNRSRDPQAIIPVENTETLQTFHRKLASQKTLRIVYYGESTTYSGRWPYQVANALRKAYPALTFFTSNVGVPGENCMQGSTRLQDEVLSLWPDLVFVEYMINDSFSGQHAEVEQSLRRIIREIKAAGADCVVVTGNGMNPQFAANGSARMFDSFYELYRRIAREESCAFIGTYQYFANLHLFGKYFITELKGNMVNHPYGNVDPDWAPLDREIAGAILRGLGA